jgi:hypothetical protein
MDDFPSAYCPITYERMVDPVITTDGHTYERNAILQWWAKCDERWAVRTSPMTGAELTSDELRPNHALRNLILEVRQNATANGIDTAFIQKTVARCQWQEEYVQAHSPHFQQWQQLAVKDIKAHPSYQQLKQHIVVSTLHRKFDLIRALLNHGFVYTNCH